MLTKLLSKIVSVILFDEFVILICYYNKIEWYFEGFINFFYSGSIEIQFIYHKIHPFKVYNCGFMF